MLYQRDFVFNVGAASVNKSPYSRVESRARARSGHSRILLRGYGKRVPCVRRRKSKQYIAGSMRAAIYRNRVDAVS